jgi:hypothetical protein
LELFIRSLGFDPILFERGDIAFSPDKSLDESCYREAKNSDVYVLIIGGRYGSEGSGSGSKKPEEVKAFFEQYDSVTRQEYKAAAAEKIPIYILIEKAVYSEFRTYLKNKGNQDIKYAHVDSVNVFKFIEDILAQRANNPVHEFERHSEIETWLREQWAGLFRELLRASAAQPQLASLAGQIAELSEVNTTLKTYLEQLLSSSGSKVDSKRLITTESKRLRGALVASRLQGNPLFSYLQGRSGMNIATLSKALTKAKSFTDFLNRVEATVRDGETRNNIRDLRTKYYREALRDYQKARLVAGLAAQSDQIELDGESLHGKSNLAAAEAMAADLPGKSE